MDQPVQRHPVRPPGDPREVRRIPLLVVLAVIGLMLAIAKPWAPAPAGPRPDPVGGPAGSPDAQAQRTSPPATAAPDPDLALVAPICLQPAGWRLYSTEHWSDRSVRSWQEMTPVASAVGPGDPSIPAFHVDSRAVLTLGYCTPVSGPDRPPGPTTTTIYRRRAGSLQAPGGDQSWDPVTTERVQPRLQPSPLGGAWGPPRGTVAGASASGEDDPGWPSGTYVFRIETTDDAGARPAFGRWFGVVIDSARTPAP